MKKFLKIFAIVLLGIFFIKFTSNFVEAKVNSDYKNITVQGGEINEDAEEENKKTTLGDKIMQYIGRFVFSLAKLVEMAVTNFSKWLFGVDVFPWEDYIVYNSLPYLDINFFNPSPGSIFTVGDKVNVGSMIRTVYFSLLTMALSILGIGVAITAIRLAVSTIAAEKAKYKEAITKCLYTVVMLFSIHILISFVFYLNETIVFASSKMLKNLITAQEMAELEEAVKNQDTSQNYTFAHYNAWPYNAKGINILYIPVQDVQFLVQGGNGPEYEDYYDVMNLYYNATSTKEGAAVFAFLIHKMDYVKNRGKKGYYVDLNHEVHSNGLHTTPGVCVNTLRRICNDTNNITSSKDLTSLASKFNDQQKNSSWYKYVEEASKAFIIGAGNENAVSNVISSLGEYFKDRTESILGDDEFNYVALILYSVLLVQSLMLLINYIKRVFYVTLLTLLAPIVVIYDFFISAI